MLPKDFTPDLLADPTNAQEVDDPQAVTPDLGSPQPDDLGEEHRGSGHERALRDVSRPAGRHDACRAAR